MLDFLTRSGATDAEVALRMPGDDLVPDAVEQIDRAATFGVPVEMLWPWVAQLGKGRAGWYLPRWVETVIPRSRRAIRRVDPAWQTVEVGDEVADWGPGEPVLRAVAVEAPTTLAWHSLRDRGNDHRWPAGEPSGRNDGVLAISWTLALRPVDGGEGGTRLHLRLRVRAKHAWLARLGGFVDWLTVVGLFAGLRERVRDVPSR